MVQDFDSPEDHIELDLVFSDSTYKLNCMKLSECVLYMYIEKVSLSPEWVYVPNKMASV